MTLAGRYALLARIGRGGMGDVYRAHDRELDELIATLEKCPPLACVRCSTAAAIAW